MSDFVRPHRWQPTRPHRSWDSPGKNTGVGCHFLLQCMKVKSESEVAQSCPTPCNPMDCSPPGSSVHGISRQENWSGLSFPPPGEGKCFPFSPSWRWERLSTPVFWPGEFNGLYSPWGCKESDMTERLSLLQRIFLTQGSNPHLLCLLHW